MRDLAFRLVLPSLGILWLASCGGARPAAEQGDRILQRETRAGQLAFDLERPAEAITQYRVALRRAEARDDLQAIGDLGYNIVVAELAANKPKDALSTARTTRDELRRRGAAEFSDLDLAEATALYRTGALVEADALAARVQEAGEPAVAIRASLLRGLIADDRGDIPALRAATLAIAQPITKPQQADATELAARLSLRQGDAARARADAERAAELRRETLDYRGVARALAVAAAAARVGGDMAAAADLYLRAGRSAAAQGDAIHARFWLRDAQALATDPALRRAVASEMASQDLRR